MNLVQLTIRTKNPTYFLIDWKRNFNSNEKCYEKLNETEKTAFWDQFKAVAVGASADPKLYGNKEGLFKKFNIVKLKMDTQGEYHQGVYGNDCSTGLRNSFTKWGSRNTTAAGKNIHRGITGARDNINLARDTIRTKGIKEATKLGATNLKESVGSAAMATQRGFTTVARAAKHGITDLHHRNLGKNNYIKSLIREIRKAKNNIDDLRSNVTLDASATQDDIAKLQEQKKSKLEELKNIDNGKFVEIRDGELGLPKKSIDCQIKTILKSEYGTDDKLIEVCSCNDSRTPGLLSRNVVALDLAGTGGGKRRNAKNQNKRTSKKRNASKKRRNASKNNNRR